MTWLIGCETSGIVRDAFRARGIDAVSCDLLPSERDGPHILGDVRAALQLQRWSGFIVHPECTYLSVSGLHWNKRVPGRAEKTERALEFVRDLFELSAHVPKFCLENPVSCISTRIMKPSQIIQPYEFGHDASKKTCFWLRGLPELIPTEYVAPRVVAGRPRWANQTDSGQNRLTPSPTRWLDRARTYPGIADAMVDQWGRRR